MTRTTDENLVRNPGFRDDADGWAFVSPRPELALVSSVEDGSALVVEAAGDNRAFGSWKGSAEMKVGTWYKATVRAEIQEIENPHLSLLAVVGKHFLAVKESTTGTVLFEQVFQHERSDDGNEVALYFRAAEAGRCAWRDPRVIEISEPTQRIARVATVRFGESATGITKEKQRIRMVEMLEQAGRVKPDIVLLPEFTPLVGVPVDPITGYDDSAESVPGGPTARALAEAAARHGMYVACGMIERRGPHLFNTAVLFDRGGELVGRYDKTHLTIGELDAGISCGESYPVFDLDFGRIGIHICYDEWFPEVVRYYAHQGVEVVLLPVAGGKPITWRTRALDNGIYFVAAAITPPSMVIDSSGAIVAQTHGEGAAYADVNLDHRRTNHYGDPTLVYGMPCIQKQMRNTLDDRLLEDLGRLMAGRE